jgi:hypothetical protein
MADSPEDFLTGGGAPAAKWKDVGDKVGGTVLFYEMADRTDYDTGEILYWDAVANKKVVESKASPGSKVLRQLVMTIQSEATGFTYEGLQYTRKELPDDDGQRRLFIMGALKEAVTKALKTGSFRLETGAYIEIERTADKPSTNPKYAPAHQYAVSWTPKTQNSHAASDFLSKPDADAAPEPSTEDPWA